MRRAKVFFNDQLAGFLTERENDYCFEYVEDYKGPSISRSLPRAEKKFSFQEFPPFFDGLLPEGINLEAFLKKTKIDRKDYFKQLLAVGRDLVGAVSVEEAS